MSWTTEATTSAQASGLSLSANTTYYASVRAVDNAGTTATSAGWVAGDPCDGNPTPGTVCTGGALFVDSYGGNQYMTTPDGCTDSPTPTCDGSTDTLTKTWGADGITTGRTSTTDGPGNSSYLATNYPSNTRVLRQLSP